MSKVACTCTYVIDNIRFKKITITQIQYIHVQQILVVTFEYLGAARGFMIMSCAARGVKKVGQHWSRSCTFLSLPQPFDFQILACRPPLLPSDQSYSSTPASTPCTHQPPSSSSSSFLSAASSLTIPTAPKHARYAQRLPPNIAI